MEDQFIDPESDFVGDKNTYEEIIINQIRKTADSLSKDLTVVIVSNSKKGTSYREDNRKIAINHIKTLRGLLGPFIENKKEEQKILIVEKEINNYVNVYGKKKIMVRGRGEVEIANLVHNVDSLYYNNLMEYKSDMYRKIFDILVSAYKKYKDDIASFSIE